MTGARLEATALGSLADRWVAAWTAAQDAAFAPLCTPDVGYEDAIAIDPLEGPAALEGHARAVHAAFPDLRLERRAAPLGDGSFACLPWRALGTNTGSISDLPPTGRFLSLHGLHYVELSDGLVRRARGFFDLYDVGVQLGLAPSRGGLAEKALLMLRGFGLRSLG